MALRFDTPNLRMDAGNRYDSALVPPVVITLTTKRSKNMNQFKLELQKKTVLQKLAMGVTHIAAMLANAFYPQATRVPTDAQFQAAQDDLQAANDDANLQEGKWKAANALRDEKQAIWDTIITARASNCEAVTPNDLAKLSTVGLPLKGAPTPIGDMPAPANLRATMGDDAGEIDLQWDAIYGAVSYVIECREYNPATGWSQIKLIKQSKFTVTGLTSGKTYAFRVRALGPKGEGPWSDEAVKMAA
ncbi:MAG: fibronectin type III domain-containing protein [Prosthecobacter sp.]